MEKEKIEWAYENGESESDTLISSYHTNNKHTSRLIKEKYKDITNFTTKHNNNTKHNN
jgi:hypothetical protein